MTPSEVIRTIQQNPIQNFAVLDWAGRCDCCNSPAHRFVAYTDSEYANYICAACVQAWAAALQTDDNQPGAAL